MTKQVYNVNHAVSQEMKEKEISLMTEKGCTKVFVNTIYNYHTNDFQTRVSFDYTLNCHFDCVDTLKLQSYSGHVIDVKEIIKQIQDEREKFLGQVSIRELTNCNN